MITHPIPLIGFSAMVLMGAVWVVTLRNLFRAALSLGIVLLGVAGLFILLHAEFLAFVQVLIYVGAILVLIVFAVMLTARWQPSTRALRPRQPALAALAAVALCGLLIAGMEVLLTVVPQAPGDGVGLERLGLELIKTLVLPFEVISLVFVSAMVGAIALAARPPAAGRGPNGETGAP